MKSNNSILILLPKIYLSRVKILFHVCIYYLQSTNNTFSLPTYLKYK